MIVIVSLASIGMYYVLLYIVLQLLLVWAINMYIIADSDINILIVIGNSTVCSLVVVNT